MIINGNNIEELKKFDDNYFDSIVTDPPYEIGFMGKSWDASGIANNPEMWSECLRVLKPGGYLLSFSATRTYHRMAVAIEDSGFEIRDMIEWVYGSGFPKSLNIGKAVDKIAEKDTAVVKAKKELGVWLRNIRKKKNMSSNDVGKFFPSKMGGLTGCVRNWELGFNLPTWETWVRLKELLELDNKFDYLIEGRPNNWIEREREVIGYQERGNAVNTDFMSGGNNITKGTSEWEGWGTALKPAHEPICMARKPLAEKTVAENVLKYGTGGINIDESRVAHNEPEVFTNRTAPKSTGEKMGMFAENGKLASPNQSGRFPANLIHDNSEEVRECFPNESERFFKSIIYQAKASKSERGVGNIHPTVKPVALMEYLIKMVTPTNGIVLDPFMGSGSTGVACVLNDFEFVGIDLDKDYCEIARARIEGVKETQTKMF
jgi:DNA modification methylase